MKIKFYSDPGHGWAAVKRDLLTDLGILEKVSQFSYQKGQTVYLEEDCDMSLLISALNLKGIKVEYEEKSTEKRSPIRNYASFSVG